VNLKTVAWWAVVAFLVWWVIEQPAAGAHLVHNIGQFLSNAGAGLSNFVSSI
jgi:hypothetical protein